MTITTVAINCDIGLANNSEFTAAQLEFTLSEADYDTLSNDSIPAATVIVALNASGVGTANLWPVTRGTRNSFYTVVLVGSRTINGQLRSDRFTLGRIAPPATGAPFALADLLAQSSGGIVVGSTVYATLADAVAAALAAANDAQSWTPAFAQEAVTAANALATASLGGSVSFTPANLNPITLPSATWIITDLYASGLPQFSPDDWEQVGSTLTLKRSYHIGQRIDYRYRIAQTSTLSTSTLADGTAALPALAFTNNANMGLYRIGANVLGFSVNATERMRLTTTGAQITGLLTGTAVTQSATDTTAGRLLKVGDYGLGGAPVLAPANIGVTDDSIARGVWYTAASTSVTGLPANLAPSSQNYFFHHRRVNAGEVQLLLAESATADADRCIWFRRRTASAWGNWKRVFDWGNILGPVSQSGGVPTGAIIERGSNANGEFVRFADGTQICTHSLSASNTADTTWTFPAAFSVAPSVAATPNSSLDAVFAACRAPTATAVAFNVWATSGVRTTGGCRFVAVGRWF